MSPNLWRRLVAWWHSLFLIVCWCGGPMRCVDYYAAHGAVFETFRCDECGAIKDSVS